MCAQAQLANLTSTTSAGGGAITYAWYVNNLLVSGQTSSTLNFTIPSSGATNIRITVTANGCSASDDITLNVLPDPAGLLNSITYRYLFRITIVSGEYQKFNLFHTWSFGGAPLNSLYTFVPTTRRYLPS